jgi:hypothetical protein
MGHQDRDSYQVLLYQPARLLYLAAARLSHWHPVQAQAKTEIGLVLDLHTATDQRHLREP